MMHLTTLQIKQLEAQGCQSGDWDLVSVSDDFSCDRVHGVSFVGEVELHGFGDVTRVSDSLVLPSGLRNVTLIDCTVGRDCLIENVSGYIRNYIIEDQCYISGVGTMSVDEPSSFGNGTRVAVLNESGAREVAIYDFLSAQTAYMMAAYRYLPDFAAHLLQQVDLYAASRLSSVGRIGWGSRIMSVTTINDINTGPCTILNGCLRLVNGTINSSEKSVGVVGQGVVASDFIVAPGGRVDSSAQLVRSFVGQGSVVAMGFSAHDSLFFSNSVCENGEACALMAGPFTVSMHKSTLMIGAMTSFSNFGSGSNQSNHLYKLGPLHQGILDRGAKTASNSYILFPAHIGAFTMVMGSHYGHPDISLLPFSYLIENQGVSHLTPAINIATAGTLRDALKWPGRDKRASSQRLDNLNFEMLSPYTISRIIQGREILRELLRTEKTEYSGCHIKPSAALRAVELYTMALEKYFGGLVVDRLLKGMPLSCDTPLHGNWVDMAGMIAPTSEIEKLTSEKLTLNEISEKLTHLQAHYSTFEWRWAYDFIDKMWDISNPKSIVKAWEIACHQFDTIVIRDAGKEFTEPLKVGFGLDSIGYDHSLGADSISAAEQDFRQVRGAADNDKFIKAVENHIKETAQKAAFAIDKL